MSRRVLVILSIMAAGTIEPKAGVAPVQSSIFFEANQGQTGERVKFLSRTAGQTLFLTADEAVIVTAKPEKIRMKFAGTNPSARITGEGKLAGKSHYFVGSDPRRWRRNIPAYSHVRYRQTYPGIDLVFYGHGAQFEYDFILEPHADPEQIRLQFDGVDKAEIDAGGNLIFHTAAGEFRQRRPVIYQEAAGGRTPIEGGYNVAELRSFPPAYEVSFKLGAYDRTKRLVIDPGFSFATFIGGKDGDNGVYTAVDSQSNVYVTGGTASADFPATTGQLQNTTVGSSNIFVAKFDRHGTLVYSTFLGAPTKADGFDVTLVRDIAADAGGNAYITGTTHVGFAMTPGAFQAAPSSGRTGPFFAKLDSFGQLRYSTFFGGEYETVFAIDADAGGKAYLTGYSWNPNSPFPTTPGAFQRTSAGYSDAFVAKFDPAGMGLASLLYSTYLGGGSYDFASDIAADAAGNAYVVGTTVSPNFPMLNPIQTSGGSFITKLNSAGSALVYSTQLTGDLGTIAVDALGSAFVAGFTNADNFPVTPGAYQPFRRGLNQPLCRDGDVDGCLEYRQPDVTVAKLNPSGSALIYATYLGGSYESWPLRISVDNSGSASVVGVTKSIDFPEFRPMWPRPTIGLYFLTKFNPAGSGLIYSTALPFGINDAAGDASGNVYITGAAGAGFPTTPGAFQTAPRSEYDAIVAKIALVQATVSLTSLNTPNHELQNAGLAASVTDPALGLQVQVFADEDDQDPAGTETHSPDAKDIDVGTLRLRAERKDNGDGRVYLIVVKALDRTNRTVDSDCATATVPLDRTAPSIESANAQAAAALNFCRNNRGAAPSAYFVIGDGPVIGPKQ